MKRVADGPPLVWIASENALLRDCLAQEIAGREDFRVGEPIASAADLLARLDTEHPDILLFDADTLGSIPEALLARLRSKWEGSRILVLSPRADDHAVGRILRYGAAGVLGRDEGLAQLFQALQAIADGQIWARRPAIARALLSLQPGATPPARASQSLTPRERQLLALLGDGYRNKELASMLRIKEQTVKIHLHSLFRKLNVRTRVEAALKANEIA
jgi:DNA-binding NarL/FixJ family response regulator